MRHSKWRVMLSSTVDETLVDVRQIIAPTQLAAEQRATAMLQARRITDVHKTAWDRWDLGVKHTAGGGWKHVATGNAEGAITTTRIQSERELASGL